MGKYLEVNGERKNLIVLKAFALSFPFAAAYALAFISSAGLVERLLGGAGTGSFFAVWGPPVLIAAAVTLVLCLLMLPMQDKLLVPAAFACFIVYYLAFLAALVFAVDAESRPMVWQFFSIYLLPVALVSNVIGWSLYAFWRSRRKRRLAKHSA